MVCDYIFSNWKTVSRIWFQMYPSLRIRWINFVHWRSFHKIEKIITTLLRFYSCVKHMLIYKIFKWSPSIRCILIVLLSIYNTISCISFVSQCTFTSIPYTVRFNKLFVALRVPLIRWPLFKTLKLYWWIWCIKSSQINFSFAGFYCLIKGCKNKIISFELRYFSPLASRHMQWLIACEVYNLQ